MSPVIERLRSYLERQDFRQINVNIEGIFLYSRIINQVAYVSVVFDYEKSLRFTKEQHLNIIRQIKEQFATYRYAEIKFIGLVCTNQASKVKDIIQSSNEQQWIIELESLRLFIYENQESKYLNFKVDIEKLLNEMFLENRGSMGSERLKDGQESYNRKQERYNNSQEQDYNNQENYNRSQEYHNGNQSTNDYLHQSHLNQSDYATYNNELRANRNLYFTFCNTAIVIINILVFLWVEATGSSENAEHLLNSGAMTWSYFVDQHQYYRVITYMFLHAGMSHIVNNMIVLLVLGDNLERAIGKIKYVMIYFGTGIIAGLVSMVYNMVVENQPVVSVGASGAIFGVVGAMVYIVIANKGRLEDLSTRQLVIFAAFTLYGGFTSQGVDNMAHVGGFLSGIILAMLLYRKTKRGRI